MEEEKLTWADIMRGFEESRRRSDKLDAQIAETDALIKETAAQIAEAGAQQKVTDALIKETAAQIAEVGAQQKKTKALVSELTKNVSGISDSNGLFAEEFFFNTLSEKKEFAGIHFDEVEDDIGYRRKLPDGKRVKDQFDILMTNDASVAIVEIKYRARKDDVETLAVRKLKNFKILFPEYNGLKIYLGLAALAFEDDAIDEARKYGVGLLQQTGETMEYAADWEVKAY